MGTCNSEGRALSAAAFVYFLGGVPEGHAKAAMQHTAARGEIRNQRMAE